MNETPQFTTKELITLIAILKADIYLDRATLEKETVQEFKKMLGMVIAEREEILTKAEQIWESYTQ